MNELDQTLEACWSHALFYEDDRLIFMGNATREEREAVVSATHMQMWSAVRDIVLAVTDRVANG